MANVIKKYLICILSWLKYVKLHPLSFISPTVNFRVNHGGNLSAAP